MNTISKILYIIVLVFVLCCVSTVSHAQEESASNDTTSISDKKTIKNKTASRAALYSAIVPGMGQIYNKKYWKVPILYTAVGTLIFFTLDNNNKYVQYKEAFANIGSPGPYKSELLSRPIMKQYTDEQLTDILSRSKDNFRRYRDINIILMGLLYLANVVDASVDGNFSTYDISPDLSMQLHPVAIPTNDITTPKAFCSGLQLTFSF